VDGEVDGKGGKQGDALAESFGGPQVEFWVQHRLPWVREVDGATQLQTFI